MLNEKWPIPALVGAVGVRHSGDEDPRRRPFQKLNDRWWRYRGLGGPPEAVRSVMGPRCFSFSYTHGWRRETTSGTRNRRQVRKSVDADGIRRLTGGQRIVTGDAATRSKSSTYAPMPLVMAFVMTAVIPVATRRLRRSYPDQGRSPNLLDGKPLRSPSVGLQDGNLDGALGFKPGPSRGHPRVHLHDPVRAVDGLPRLHPDRIRRRETAVWVRTTVAANRDHVGTVTSAAAIHGVCSRLSTLELTIIKSSGWGWRSPCSLKPQCTEHPDYRTRRGSSGSGMVAAARWAGCPT